MSLGGGVRRNFSWKFSPEEKPVWFFLSKFVKTEISKEIWE